MFGEAKVCSAELRGHDLAFSLTPNSHDPELQDLMAGASKAAFGLRIFNEPFVVDEYVVQQSTSSCWFLYHLGQKIIPCFVFQQMSR